MKGLLTKDFLTVKKKYGIARLIMDFAIIAALMIARSMIRRAIPYFFLTVRKSFVNKPFIAFPPLHRTT